MSEILKPFVKVVWSMEGDRSVVNGPKMHILPDTCVELVFHFGDPYQTTFADQSTSIQSRSFIVAQMKKFMNIEAFGRTGIIAVRFTALGAYHFFGTPMKEVANGETKLELVWKALADEIEDQIQQAVSTDDRSKIVQKYLQLQLLRNGYVDKAVDFCIREIKRTNGMIRVEALANNAGLSCRQLIRRFDQYVGISPKEFARITKFISSLDMLSQSRLKTFTDVALDSGYFDQAHFIHDFREYSGMTPGEYLSATNVVY